MTIPTSKQTQAQTILQRAVCLTLNVTILGNDRKVDVNKLVDEALDTDDGGETSEAERKRLDDKAFGARKKLVDTKALRPMHAVIGAAKSYLRSRAMPAHRVFGERSYLVPLALVGEVDARLCEFQADLRAAAATFRASYEAHVAEQASRLGHLFRPQDYVGASEAEAAWTLDWNYVSFTTPENIETVNHAVFETARRKNEQQWASAYDEVKLVLRETLLRITSELVARLQPGEDGKPKAIRGTALRDMTDFLATFDARNITDDAELKAVVKRLRGLTKGLDAEQLRDAAAVREAVRTGAEQAVAALDDMVVTVRRAISFGSGPLAA